MKFRILIFTLLSIINLHSATFTDYYNSLKKYENFTTSVVLNRDGEKIVGAGINLDRHNSANTFKVGQNLAISQIDNITFDVVKKAENEVKKIFTNFDSHSEKVKIILITLVVVTGEKGVKSRSGFVEEINAKNYKSAAIHLRNSSYRLINRRLTDGFAAELEKM
jgi:hypothetical protein